MKKEDFISICKSQKPDIIVQKHIIEDETFFFTNVVPKKEFDFKKDIANILNVHIRDIVIVGSGKLGFSLKPNNAEAGLYLFNEFDSVKKSDLDVGIISSSLFDKEMKNLYDFKGFHKNNWDNKNSFAKYTLKGRIAIRFLPIDFKLTDEIKKAVEKYKMEFGREINIEIYKSWHYFETYHRENIKNIQINLLR
ncbi:hypothetical protein SAMN05216474_2109 [Lishizhenia tianjinensis]|uniref:Uncharacterized protein n=1 Tax=Lishizhenia tianjinensis TaxID=477690 RepID=A0A1I7AHX7_9FLAO|nr:hypothetical protein [Lishizhenia tianjinensis]SFT74547.1 hypothetical protein SAMN05216474_2109 [Lishizhenia tianjinensis]